MGEIFTIVILVAAVIFGAPILLFFAQSNLKKRLAEQERKLRLLENRLTLLERDDAKPTATKSDTPPAAAATQAPDKTIWKPSTPTETPDKTPLPANTEKPVAAPKPKRPNHIGQFAAWLRENWVLAAGAASLALAGIFLVQYGAERGLLTPPARVVLALVFGLMLIAGGEFLRRRFGDETDSATRFLPSALSGAGFFTLFAAILAARTLYGLIGPGTAFAGLVITSAASVIFGWFYGALLSGVGIVGSIAAPYLVGGQSDTPWLFHYYFALIAIAALAIDSVKRWAWLSVIALVGTGASMWLLHLGTDTPHHFLFATLILAASTLTLPERQIWPRLDGPPISALALRQTHQGFVTWLAFAAAANATLAAFAVGATGNLAETYLALAVLGLIFIAALFWLAKAPALCDISLLPATAFLALLYIQPASFGALFQSFYQTPQPEAAPSGIALQLALIATIGSALIALRFRTARSQTEAIFLSFGAAVFAPMAIFLLEFFWTPTGHYGDANWALIVIGAAAVMTLLAERTARMTSLETPNLHAAFFAGAAISLIGLALFIVLTKTALTLALALMVLVVIAIDRRFDLPFLGLFVQIGLLIISYRIVVDPGIAFTFLRRTSMTDILLVHLGTSALLVGAMVILRPKRPRLRAGLEGALSIVAATFIVALIDRLIPDIGDTAHHKVGMVAAIWLIIVLVQLRNIEGAGRFERTLRLCLASVMGLLVAAAIAALFTLLNPLVNFGNKVLGPPFFSSLGLAYLPLAGVFAFAATRMPQLKKALRIGAGALSCGFVVWYIALSIRHFWQGPSLARSGVTDAELYSYTIAMLLGATGLLAFAFHKRNAVLRKAAMGLVGLTIAKVFLIDMSGLTGLMRVVSFMGLGLALLALTWLNRLMEAAWDRDGPNDLGG